MFFIFLVFYKFFIFHFQFPFISFIFFHSSINRGILNLEETNEGDTVYLLFYFPTINFYIWCIINFIFLIAVALFQSGIHLYWPRLRNFFLMSDGSSSIFFGGIINRVFCKHKVFSFLLEFYSSGSCIRFILFSY